MLQATISIAEGVLDIGFIYLFRERELWEFWLHSCRASDFQLFGTEHSGNALLYNYGSTHQLPNGRWPADAVQGGKRWEELLQGRLRLCSPPGRAVANPSDMEPHLNSGKSIQIRLLCQLKKWLIPCVRLVDSFPNYFFYLS